MIETITLEGCITLTFVLVGAVSLLSGAVGFSAIMDNSNGFAFFISIIYIIFIIFIGMLSGTIADEIRDMYINTEIESTTQDNEEYVLRDVDTGKEYMYINDMLLEVQQ